MNGNFATSAPKELRVSKDRRTLTAVFGDERMHALPAELLRVCSPSAEVQGHSPDERKVVSGKRNVMITQLIPTGRYAVRIVFDDGHDTGIYTWAFLADLGENLDEKLAAYETELGERGLSRDR